MHMDFWGRPTPQPSASCIIVSPTMQPRRWRLQLACNRRRREVHTLYILHLLHANSMVC
uniref:Uncharacterized protein n=1 Tax=Setaria italica TaxID=4555 RepID=K3ZFY7_SETIT